MTNNMQRILRRSEVEQAELELARERSLTRIAAMVDGESAHGADDAATADSAEELMGSDEEIEVTEAHEDSHDLLTAVRPRSMVAGGALEAEGRGNEDDIGPLEAEAALAGDSRPPVVVIGTSYETGPSAQDVPIDAGDTSQDTLFQDDQPLASSVANVATEPLVENIAAEAAVEDVRVVDDATATAVVVEAEPVGVEVHPVPSPAPVAYCPNCATVLDPAPDATRRCARCRHKIVVRHVGARTVYLAEAAVPVFEAEQRRLIEVARWATVRDYWLQMAERQGASGDRVEKITRDEASEAKVAAARSLYISSVDRSFESALQLGRWQDAARIRYDEAVVLFDFAGAPVPNGSHDEAPAQAEAAAAE